MATKKPEEQASEINLANVQAMIAEMLAKAKEEAAQIVEEARKATEPKRGGMTREELEKHHAEMNELVEVKLFKDTGKYKDDVFVGVNGEFIAIKRGERVKIKRKFALVLEESDRQDYETARMIEEKSGEWERKRDAAGL